MAYTHLLVMGVQGSGKSTLGRALAEASSVPFVDGDDLHSERNIALMAAGVPLTDADRTPWLHAIGDVLRRHDNGVVVACSALKRDYRDLLRGYRPGLFTVHLHGDETLIHARIAARNHEFMPPTLLQSQLATLEPLQPDELGMRVDVAQPVPAIVTHVLHTTQRQEAP